MVEWTAEQKRDHERGIREDFAEFLAAYRLEAGKSRGVFVPARMLTLTGDSLRALEKRRLIENNGWYEYRPLVWG